MKKALGSIRVPQELTTPLFFQMAPFQYAKRKSLLQNFRTLILIIGNSGKNTLMANFTPAIAPTIAP
jgi:hypothetical protein